MTSGFLSKKNYIFEYNKNDRNTKKTRKTGRSISSRINGNFNNTDSPGEFTNIVLNSNINPKHRQKRVKN